MAEILLYACIPLLFAAVCVAVFAVPQYLKRRALSGRSPGLVLYRGPLAVSLVCMLLGLVVTVRYAEAARQAEYAEARTHFLHEVDQLEVDLQGQISGLEHLLSGLRGLFVSSDYVSRTDFRNYEDSRDSHLAYPGFRGLGFIERVQRTGLPAFENQMRREFGPQYQVRSTGGLPDLFVIKYLEPLARNQSALGFDMGSEPVRRAAAEAAMRSGQATMTPPIRLVQDALQRPGFLLLLPVYASIGVPPTQAEREKALRGWAYAPVVFSELMAVDSGINTSALNFQVFAAPDLSQRALVYDSLLPAGEVSLADSLQRDVRSTNSVVRPILVADQLLYLRVNSSPAFEAGYHSSEYLNSALLGSGTSVLAAMVLWLLMVGRARALNLVEGMTHNLERLAMVAKRTSNAVYFADTEWRINWINEGFTRMSGFSEAEALGLRPSELLHSPLADPTTAETIDAKVRRTSESTSRFCNAAKAGVTTGQTLRSSPSSVPMAASRATCRCRATSPKRCGPRPRWCWKKSAPKTFFPAPTWAPGSRIY